MPTDLDGDDAESEKAQKSLPEEEKKVESNPEEEEESKVAVS